MSSGSAGNLRLQLRQSLLRLAQIAALQQELNQHLLVLLVRGLRGAGLACAHDRALQLAAPGPVIASSIRMVGSPGLCACASSRKPRPGPSCRRETAPPVPQVADGPVQSGSPAQERQRPGHLCNRFSAPDATARASAPSIDFGARPGTAARRRAPSGIRNCPAPHNSRKPAWRPFCGFLFLSPRAPGFIFHPLPNILPASRNPLSFLFPSFRRPYREPAIRYGRGNVGDDITQYR